MTTGAPAEELPKDLDSIFEIFLYCLEGDFENVVRPYLLILYLCKQECHIHRHGK